VPGDEVFDTRYAAVSDLASDAADVHSSLTNKNRRATLVPSNSPV